jgi:phosphoenolpyruvate carboxylase
MASSFCRARAGEGKDAGANMLFNKLSLRAPYVVPLNMLQALCMAEIRQMGPGTDSKEGSSGALSAKPGLPRNFSTASARLRLDWNAYADPETWQLLNRDPENVPDKNLLLQAYKDTLIITIKGIAAGMQNTG